MRYDSRVWVTPPNARRATVRASCVDMPRCRLSVMARSMCARNSSSRSASSLRWRKSAANRLKGMRIQSIDGLLTGGGEEARHGCGHALPAFGFHIDLLAPDAETESWERMAAT